MNDTCGACKAYLYYEEAFFFLQKRLIFVLVEDDATFYAFQGRNFSKFSVTVDQESLLMKMIIFRQLLNLLRQLWFD